MSKEDVDKSKIEYREANPEDAEGMLKVNLISWLDTYINNDLGITKELIIKEKGSPETLTAERINKWKEHIRAVHDEAKGKFWVAVYENKVVGYSGIVKENDLTFSITGIYVLPNFQRMGIGSTLFNKLLAYVGRDTVLSLSVANYNQKAINFYLKHGFEITNETHNFRIGQSEYYIPCIKMVRKAKT